MVEHRAVFLCPDNPLPPMILADITRAKPGTETAVLQSLVRKFGEPTPQTVTVVCYPSQEQSIQGWRDKVAVAVVSGVQTWFNVTSFIHKTWIEAIGTTSNLDALTVITFHPGVLQLKDTLSPQQKEKVSLVHWTELAPTPTPSSPSTTRPTQYDPLAGFALSKDEILRCLVRGLERVGAPVTQQKIRPILVGENGVFAADNYETRPHFISRVVEIAEREGVIRVDRTRADTPIISLTIAPPATAATVQAHSGAAAQTSNSEEPRSDQFFSILRSLDLGPYTRIRAQLYDSLEKRAKEKSYSCNTIIRKAVDDVSASKPDGKFPWHNVTKFLYNLLSKHAVLADENGKSRSPSLLEDVGISIHGFTKAQWKDELDACIIETIIEKDRRGVDNFDIPPLAAVVCNSLSQESQERVESLLAMLRQNKRISEKNKRYQVSP